MNLLRGLLMLLALGGIAAGAHFDVRFQSLTIDDGLSQNTVTVILQDREGFLWFGTDDGFNRYDGYSFRAYKRSFHQPGSGLSHNRVMTALEDRSGRLWIGTLGGGLNRLDPIDGTIRVYRHRPADPGSLSNDYVHAIGADRQGRIWIGTEDGLNRFDETSGRFTRLLSGTRPGEAEGLVIKCLRPDGDSGWWCGTQGRGIIRIDSEGRVVDTLRIAGGVGDNPALDDVNAIFVDDDRTIWLGTEAGLVHFDPASRALVRRPPGADRDLFNARVTVIVSDHEGNRWLGTEFGLTLIHSSRRLAEVFSDPTPPRPLLGGQFVLSILEDRTGIVWIGTHSGIFKIDPRNQQFHSFRNLLRGNTPGAEPLRILAIAEDSRQRLWMGTYKSGLLVWDRKEGSVLQCGAADDGRPGLPGDIVTALYESPDRKMWIGTQKGLALFDTARQAFCPLPDWLPSPPPWGTTSINRIAATLSGTLWIGTDNGLIRLDPERRRWESFRHDPDRPDSLSNDSVLDVLEDHLGVVWVATYGGGLNRFDANRGGFTRFRHRQDDPGSLSEDKIYCLHEDREGRLWIGTNSGGLNGYDRRENRFTAYTSEDGLPNNVIFGILEDQQGRLWLSTNRGLASYNLRRRQFHAYTDRDGLAGNEFLPLAHFQNSSGNMFFGGTGGLTSFRPMQITSDTAIPALAFTSVSIPTSGRIIDGQNLARRPLYLSAKDSIVTIAFAALNYSDPQQNQFAYRLDPLTPDWVPLGTRHEITLTNLRPGAYRFRIRGSNRDLLWNETGISLPVFVQPPFWQTWWFRLLATIGLTGLALLVVWVRHRLLSWKKIAAPPDLDAICRDYGISNRERDVLQLVVQGKSNRQIENELFISVKTVKTHLYNLYNKCGVRNRLELINFLQGKKPSADS